MIDLKVRDWFFDSDKVLRAVESAKIKNLSKAGAFVMTRARTSIRPATRRRSVSRPGEKPVSHVGTLKRFIYFSYDPASGSVVVGPAKVGAVVGVDAPHSIEYGGPVIAPGVARGVHMAARPFMHPALEAEAPNFPGLWKDTVK